MTAMRILIGRHLDIGEVVEPALQACGICGLRTLGQALALTVDERVQIGVTHAHLGHARVANAPLLAVGARSSAASATATASAARSAASAAETTDAANGDATSA